LATTHHQIGVIFVAANDPNSALPHYAESLRLKENERDEYGAGKTRYNIARALGMLGRFSDAKDYACTAVDNFTSYGVAAAEELQQTRALLVEIERHLQEKKN
jgi:hypothetical protein